jgi:hypothetical protein
MNLMNSMDTFLHSYDDLKSQAIMISKLDKTLSTIQPTNKTVLQIEYIITFHTRLKVITHNSLHMCKSLGSSYMIREVSKDADLTRSGLCRFLSDGYWISFVE